VKRAVFAALVTAMASLTMRGPTPRKARKPPVARGVHRDAGGSQPARQIPALLASVLADPKTSGGVRDAALRALPLMGPDNAKANFVTLASYVTKGIDQTSAARAIAQLPRESWTRRLPRR